MKIISAVCLAAIIIFGVCRCVLWAAVHRKVRACGTNVKVRRPVRHFIVIAVCSGVLAGIFLYNVIVLHGKIQTASLKYFTMTSNGGEILAGYKEDMVMQALYLACFGLLCLLSVLGIIFEGAAYVTPKGIYYGGVFLSSKDSAYEIVGGDVKRLRITNLRKLKKPAEFRIKVKEEKLVKMLGKHYRRTDKNTVQRNN